MNMLQVLVVIMNMLLVVNELLLPFMLIWHNMTSSHPTTTHNWNNIWGV
jgi:hypothetical protein